MAENAVPLEVTSDIFSWVNDKSSLLFGRGEAPIISLPNKMKSGEIIFIANW